MRACGADSVHLVSRNEANSRKRSNRATKRQESFILRRAGTVLVRWCGRSGIDAGARVSFDCRATSIVDLHRGSHACGKDDTRRHLIDVDALRRGEAADAPGSHHIILIDAVAGDAESADERIAAVHSRAAGEEDDAAVVLRIVRIMEVRIGVEGVVSLNAGESGDRQRGAWLSPLTAELVPPSLRIENGPGGALLMPSG